mgnify:CR=1 FL=1
MLYWFFVKRLGTNRHPPFGTTAQGLENIPHEGGAIIAANHLAVIDDALLPLTCPRMIHFMGKAEYFEGKGIKGKFKNGGSRQSACSPWTVPAVPNHLAH